MNTQLKYVELLNPIQSLKEVREQIKALQELENQYKDQIHNLLDSSGKEGLTIGDFSVVRSMAERTSIDSKSLKTQCPEIFEKYSKSTTYITLKLS